MIYTMVMLLFKYCGDAICRPCLGARWPTLAPTLFMS